MSGPLTIRTPAGVTYVGSTGLMTIIRGSHDKFYVGHVGFNTSTKEWVGWGQNGRNGTKGAIQVPKSFPNARAAVNYVNGVITKKYDKDGYDLEQSSSYSSPSHPTFNGAAAQQIEAKAAQLGLVNAPAAPAPAAPAGQTAAEKAKAAAQAKKAAEAKKEAAAAKKAAAGTRAANRPKLSSMDALVAAAAQQHVSPVSMILGDDDD